MTFRPRPVPAATLLAVLAAGCSTTTGDAPSVGDQAASAVARASAQVTVQVNHCFVEPVDFDAERWNVPFEKQFGWGGKQPPHWQGVGTMVRLDGARARFRDAGGATVVFRRVDDPAVRPVEDAGCA